MASDLFVFEGSSSPSSSFYPHSTPEFLSLHTTTEFSFFFENDPFSSLDVLQTIIDQPNPVDELSSFDQFASTVLSSSPPSNQFENLSLGQSTQYRSQQDSSFFANGYEPFTQIDNFEVKTEQNIDSSSYIQNLLPHSYGAMENAAKYMQRSFSSNSFDGKPTFEFDSQFDFTLERSNNLHNLSLSAPENGSFAGHIRRVCSTGDLQEPNFKVGRYSAEERKEKISKYRAKRTQRNFNKTIKYACRKALADNRPRIRGRFARNDEIAETPKIAFSSAPEEEEDDFWVGDGLHEEGDSFVSSFAQIHGCF